MILTPSQKFPNNVGNLGKIIVATGFECLPKKQKSPNLVTLVRSSNGNGGTTSAHCEAALLAHRKTILLH